MSIADAIRDGVKYEHTAYGLVYFIPCSDCGRIYGRRQYSGRGVYLCPYCRELRSKKKKAFVRKIAESIPDAETKEEKRYRTAVETLEKQVRNFRSYSRAIEICRKSCLRFGSVPEAMMAIALVKNGYKVIPQQKIGDYRVDFALPDEKLIIEVDGSIYHADTEKEMLREGRINYAIGLDWHVIHIPAESITEDVEKVIRLLKKGTQGTIKSFNMKS